MTTLAEITTMLPMLTRYSMPSDSTQAQLYFDLAEEQVNTDAPSISGLDRNKAECYFIAHLMATQDMSFLISTEQLGSSSASYLGYKHKRSGYYSEYLAVIKRYAMKYGFIGTHEDAEYMQDYPLDGNRVSL